MPLNVEFQVPLSSWSVRMPRTPQDADWMAKGDHRLPEFCAYGGLPPGEQLAAVTTDEPTHADLP